MVTLYIGLTASVRDLTDVSRTNTICQPSESVPNDNLCVRCSSIILLTLYQSVILYDLMVVGIFAGHNSDTRVSGLLSYI